LGNVNAGTLKYAYSLLYVALPPPPDLHLAAYSPGKMLLMTGLGTPVPCSRRRQGFEAHSARPSRYGDSEDPRRDVAYATSEEKLLLVLTRGGLDGSKT